MEHLDLPGGFAEGAEREDAIFQQLDNRRIGIGTDSWTAQVCGVHLSDRGAWLQIAPKEHPSESVVVHVERGIAAGQIALALAKWGQIPEGERPLVIHASLITGN